MNLNDIKVGTKINFEKYISSEDLKLYKLLTNDQNPIHYDEIFAKKTIFKRPIVPGLITISSFVSILAKFYPGAVITKIEILFNAPVYLDEKLKGVVEIISITPLKKKGTLKIEISNSNGVVVLDAKLDCFFGAKINEDP